MLRKILVPIAHGTEEIEAVTIIDVLRRGGLEVWVAKVPRKLPDNQGLTCLMSRGVIMNAERMIDDLPIESLDAIVLPGG